MTKPDYPFVHLDGTPVMDFVTETSAGFQDEPPGHLMDRTSPIGTPFRGQCRYCGIRGGPGLARDFCEAASKRRGP